MADSFPVVYDRAIEPTLGPSPGAQALMKHTIEEFGATNLGIYNNRPVRGGTSLSKHARGEAGDSGFPYTVGGVTEGWRLANWLLTFHRELGVQQVIYARKIWSNQRDQEGWRPYTGSAAHYEHVHWELTAQAAAELTTKMIRDRTGFLEEEDMSGIPEECIEELLCSRIERAYQLITDRSPDIGGLRFWCGRMLQAYRSGGDVGRVLRSLESALMNEVPVAEREQLSALLSDSNG